MYALVSDVESYPAFLPWCRDAEIVERSAGEVVASLEIAKSGLHRRFTTRNRLWPGEKIEMNLEKGPFNTLGGDWRFIPLADEGSKVSLDLEFEFSSRLLDAVFAPVFAEIMSALVDAFVGRATRLYGHG